MPDMFEGHEPEDRIRKLETIVADLVARIEELELAEHERWTRDAESSEFNEE